MHARVGTEFFAFIDIRFVKTIGDYYFIAPAKVFKRMALHSNLSLFIFQDTNRGNLFVEGLRYFCFAIHSLCFILLVLRLFILKQTDWRLVLLLLISLFYVFYLSFFQRGIEERYTLPLLPILLIIMFSTTEKISASIRNL